MVDRWGTFTIKGIPPQFFKGYTPEHWGYTLKTWGYTLEHWGYTPNYGGIPPLGFSQLEGYTPKGFTPLRGYTPELVGVYPLKGVYP